MFFKVLKKSKKSKARLGLIKTAHGPMKTPAFFPVATKATVKSLTPEEVKEIGFEGILANTYHLYLQPGNKLIKKLGGLHRFMNWPGPIATDSGGFQVFSLGRGFGSGIGKILKPEQVGLRDSSQKPKLVEIDQDGVTFTSHLDGSQHRFTPEISIKIQEDLGADIIFAFDEATSPLADYEYNRWAMERTHCWAKRCLKVRKRPSRGGSKDQALFGIVQGGPFKELREASAQFIGSLPFEGFGVGGSYGVGDSLGKVDDVLDWVIPYLPDNKPRHLLGIGYLNDINMAVKKGIDLFDCVMPTRLGRHGVFLTDKGEINILRQIYRADSQPVMKSCQCYTCQNYSRAYLNHLFKANEILAARLATYHNLWFLARFFGRIREEIKQGKF
ncbi:tRNA guanosine(34) transglycosylase Tgt [Patescibacteria group bacterium]|nr:tRNA guanosine(34) transglycosylase Tgt [Patescibacteria group bacterium]